MQATKKINRQASRAIEWNRLRARVFKYQSSAADEKIFKARIHNWLCSPENERPTWVQLLFNIVHERNNSGRELKYVFFSDRYQRVFLDRDFEKWAQEVKEQIATALKYINGK